MIFKIKTSKATMDIFEKIEAKENLPPYILSKLSIAMSLRISQRLDNVDFSTDNGGLELNRQTITGEFDLLYKCLIEVYEGKHINEKEYLPKYLKAHIDRGAKLLYSEFRYSRDFVLQLLKDEVGL